MMKSVPAYAGASPERYLARLRLNHFGFSRRSNKKVAIKSPVPTSAHTSDNCSAGILLRVRRKMPIINGTTMRKITSLFILVPKVVYSVSSSDEKENGARGKRCDMD